MISSKTITVIYEDKDILALNKPAGISVHGDGRNNEPTIVDWLSLNYPSIKEVGEPATVDGKKIERPGIVHRLDKETSGVLIVIKNQIAYLFFKKQFQDKKIKKKYLVLVYGTPKEKNFVVDRPIGRSYHDFRLKAVPPLARGILRNATTNFKVVKYFKEFTLIEARPITGRTHQVRVHLKSVGHPVVCDKLYASKRKCLPDYSFQMLHAYSIELENIDGQRILIEASLPDDFQKALDNLKPL